MNKPTKRAEGLDSERMQDALLAEDVSTGRDGGLGEGVQANRAYERRVENVARLGQLLALVRLEYRTFGNA